MLPEIVVKLQIGGLTSGLVHGTDDVRTLVVLIAQEPREYLPEGTRMVQVVKDNYCWQI